jgi:hypothetical protein
VLEPGTAAMAEVRISPPRPLTGAVRRHTVQVQAHTTQGRRWEATAVFNQAPLLGRRRLLLLGAGAAAVALAIVLLILFMPGDGDGDGQPSNSTLSVRGSIESPGAQDRYTTTGRQSQQLYLDVEACPAAGILEATLLAPDDEAVFQDQSMCSDGTAASKTVTLPQDGSYELTVQGRDNATGAYRVTLWSVPAAQQFSLAIGDSIIPDRNQPGPGAGNIESPGAQDRYSFTGRKGQQIYLDVRECPAAGILEWTLLGPNNEAVFPDESMCSGGSPVDKTVTLPRDGSHQLIVHGRDGATGSYRVKLESR